MQYKTLGLYCHSYHSCLHSNEKKYTLKPTFVPLTVDVVDFSRIKIEQVYVNAKRYIVSSCLYIIIA